MYTPKRQILLFIPEKEKNGGEKKTVEKKKCQKYVGLSRRELTTPC